MTRNFDGRHFVVTGAGSGIGRAIARRLAADGAALTLVGRREPQLRETLDAKHASMAVIAPADIRDASAIDRALALGVEQNGAIHGLVANAGIGGPNAPGDADRFEELVATNLTGSYRTARAVEPHLAAGPEPRQLVFVASILARIGVPGYTGYCASKAGLLGLVRALAMEHAAANVAVNAICPGWVDTQMARDGLADMAAAMNVTPEEAHDVAMRDVPLGRMGQPDEIAGVVAWLLSPDAHGVTGQAIDANGGAWM